MTVQEHHVRRFRPEEGTVLDIIRAHPDGITAAGIRAAAPEFTVPLIQQALYHLDREGFIRKLGRAEGRRAYLWGPNRWKGSS